MVEAELRRALADDSEDPDASTRKSNFLAAPGLHHGSIVSGESSIFLHHMSHVMGSSLDDLPADSPSSTGHGQQGQLGLNRSVSTSSMSRADSFGNYRESGKPQLQQLRYSLAEAPPSVNTIAMPRDHLPEHLFQPTNIIHPLPTQLSIAAQPIALKTAMKTLQRALEQPLTNYDAVPSRWSVNEHDYGRHTLTSKLRQQPRIPLTTAALTGGDAANDQTTSAAHKPVVSAASGGTANKSRLLASAGQRGLAEPVALKKVREEARQRTMQQIDFVLQSLNESTQRLTTFERPDVDALHALSSASNGNGSSGGNGGGNNNQRDDLQGIAAVKQTMERMRNFARPQSGVKQIVHLAKDILDEFH